MRGKTPCSLLEKLFEVYSCTPYSGKTPGFCCWVSFSLLSKDCEIWPALDNRVVFQAAVVFSNPRLALHEARAKLGNPPPPALSWSATYLPCTFSVSTVER